MMFSEKLKKAMQELEINQAKVVSLTGKSKGSISQYLSGKQTPSEKVQGDIAVSLGLAPDYFEKEDGELDVCGHGMHFCEKASDCFNYYQFDSNNKVAEVIAYGQVIKEGDKSCTGFCNTGDWNTGNCNTGNCNTGDWNKSSFNNGCFMTEEPKICLFNKPSDWTYMDWYNSKARYLLNHIPKDVVEWVYSEDMTDEEKAEHPTHETTGGYLKVLDESNCGQLWWGSLTDAEKNIIKAIPSTGVKVDG